MSQLNGRSPTASVLLELKEERQVVRDGYQFLDEKRMLLAAEVVRQLRLYEELHQHYLQRQRQATQALALAVARHGFEGLQVHPTHPLQAQLTVTERLFLGVRLEEVELQLTPAAPTTPLACDSPESRQAEQLFQELLTQTAQLAALTGNLERLLAEYRHTQRRTRALEDVLLPELESAIAEVTTRLEEMDQEEAIRVRLDYGAAQ